jgi:hypothetical protein
LWCCCSTLDLTFCKINEMKAMIKREKKEDKIEEPIKE